MMNGVKCLVGNIIHWQCLNKIPTLFAYWVFIYREFKTLYMYSCLLCGATIFIMLINILFHISKIKQSNSIINNKCVTYDKMSWLQNWCLYCRYIYDNCIHYILTLANNFFFRGGGLGRLHWNLHVCLFLCSNKFRY